VIALVIVYPEAMPTARPTTPHLNLRAETEQPSGSAPFESWGRYPTYDAKIIPLHWQSDFPAVAAGLHNGALPVGMGRSYGDVCLLKDGNLLLTTGMDRLIDFDAETGLLTAEGGVTLAQILDFAVPRGFFLPVSPGTKYVTLGGAIANELLAATSPSSSLSAPMARACIARQRKIPTSTLQLSEGLDSLV
jgi:hypothetical protein